MIDSKYRISLDVNSTVSNVRLKCKRGDTGRSIYVALTESGYPYHITDDCYAAFTATKPDGKKVYNGCSIDGCVIIYELTPQTVAVPGLVKCEIKLYGANDKLITSASFLLEVYNAQVNDGDELESETEVEALTHLISQATGMIVKLETVPNFGAGAKVGDYLMVSEVDKEKRMVTVIPTDAPSGGNTAGPVGPVITIESKADGYWDRYNTWYDTDLTCAKRTNLIPVTAGDQYSYMGYAADAVYSVIWYDAKMAEVGNAKRDARTSAVVVTAPAGATCARFYSLGYVATVDLVILEVTKIASGSGSAAPSQSQSSLYGKKIIYDGDSICESRTGSTANNGGGYAKLIADTVGGTYVNNAVSGAALTSTPEGKTYHSVVDSLSQLPTDGDLYCFEGGYNDFCRNVAIGSCENTGYSGDLDTFTICGAMEHIFRYCLNVLVGRPVCFVIVHKCDNSHTANSAGNTFADYRNAMIAVCEKYSIPYYDAYAKSGLNGWNTVQSDAYLTANVNGTGDGTHPNEAGYKRYYVPQLIALFQSMMPTDVVQNAPGEEDAPTDPSEPAVNLIDTVGYTDGVRLSTSTGSEKTTTEAYTTTGFIRMESATEIFQTSGVVFDGDVHAQSIVCVYDSSKSLLIGAYITSNQPDGATLSLTHCSVVMDGNGNLTIKPKPQGVGCYFKLSGYGNGADLVITKR